jgi:hypothetical protein
MRCRASVRLCRCGCGDIHLRYGDIVAVRGYTFAVRGYTFAVRGYTFAVRGYTFPVRGYTFAAQGVGTTALHFKDPSAAFRVGRVVWCGTSQR